MASALIAVCARIKTCIALPNSNYEIHAFTVRISKRPFYAL